MCTEGLMTKRPELLDVGGIKVEIGPPVSTDGGLVVVARQVRRSAWFKGLVVSLRTAIAGFEAQRFGFVGEEKLSRTLLALICGFAMGYRSGKEIADVIEADKLWRKVLGSRVTQIDLSRLVCVLAEGGVDPLRVALLTSASEGIPALHLDGDSSLLELHGKQEGGAFNGHYKEFGYHAGWILEASGRLADFHVMQMRFSRAMSDNLDAFEAIAPCDAVEIADDGSAVLFDVFTDNEWVWVE